MMLVLRKTLKITGNVLFVVALVLMATVVAFMVRGKLDGGVPSVGPFGFYVVLSGSMNPEFDTGSLIAVKNAVPQDINAGDIITFNRQGDRPGDGKMIITHRVMAVNNVNGKINFITKGDANDVRDEAPVSEEQLIGRAVYWVPYMGYVTEFAKSKKGLVGLIIIPGLLILGSEIVRLYRYAAEYDEEKKRKRFLTAQENAAESKG